MTSEKEARLLEGVRRTPTSCRGSCSTKRRRQSTPTSHSTPSVTLEKRSGRISLGDSDSSRKSQCHVSEVHERAPLE
eukprot:CAMPEP_0175887844 /NCGR_PEP_ID=MMETSP0107_2-20121207/46399_1 /TAXON_ID=195067 ORGANISM="Goniomonas pacifica, Strain CCMP1869" /NCGR_SAMPLE_ID=MMETSP0107_2 /ASSEMBLY_ACC=CAM_ASM_000203 /LENGTH=76 /DNA_ID=CAMNT_0017208345 /DNA_START=385 /DNA_END=615 /DNA_ORIENTATION=-